MNHSVSFSSEMALSLFGGDVPLDRRDLEVRDIARFEQWFERSDVSQQVLLEVADKIDRYLIATLSAPSMRKVAAMVLDRCPDALHKMPNLCRHSVVLGDAHTLAALFEPMHLAAMAVALKIEE